jgi:hypothetical protein
MARVIGEILGEMEREMKGDGAAPWEDVAVANAYDERYRKALRIPDFWKRVAAGELPVDARWKTDIDGRRILAYIKIGDGHGGTLYTCDFEAMERIDAERDVLARGVKESIN